jgi:WD40 repeat protein
VSFSPNGQLMASGSINGTIQVWDVISGTCSTVLEGHCGCVNSVAFAPNSALLASGGAEGTIRLWDITGSCSAITLGHDHDGAVLSLLFSLDGTTIIAQSHFPHCQHRDIDVWDVAEGRLIYSCPEYALTRQYIPNDGRFLLSGPSVAVPLASDSATITSPNGTIIALVDKSGRSVITVRCNDGVNFPVRCTLEASIFPSGPMVFSIDDTRIACAPVNNPSFGLWDTGTLGQVTS